MDIYDANGVLIDKNFTSRFEGAAGRDEAYIAAPIAEGAVFAVRPGRHIVVYAQDGNTFYRFRARVAQGIMRDGRPALRIARLSDIDAAQRRSFYRFRCSIDFKYRVITNFKDESDKPYLEGRTTDLSGSGLGFASDEAIEPERRIELVIKPEKKSIYLIGAVKKCVRPAGENAERAPYNIGVLFIDIEEWQRDIIVKYIFNEERRQIKNA